MAILPYRRIRGIDETGEHETWIWNAATLGAVAAPYGTGAGIKTQALFVAGLIQFTLFYAITGAGTTTIRVVPMDADDANELPGFLLLVSGLASGNGALSFGQTPPIVLSSCKFQVIASVGTNTITALLFGRSG